MKSRNYLWRAVWILLKKKKKHRPVAIVLTNIFASVWGGKTLLKSEDGNVNTSVVVRDG